MPTLNVRELSVAATILLSVVGMAFAQSITSCPDGFYLTQIYPGPNAWTGSGRPVLFADCEPSPLIENWGTGGPAATTVPNSFIIVYSMNVTLLGGPYQFNVSISGLLTFQVDNLEPRTINSPNTTQYGSYSLWLLGGAHKISMTYTNTGPLSSLTFLYQMLVQCGPDQFAYALFDLNNALIPSTSACTPTTDFANSWSPAQLQQVGLASGYSSRYETGVYFPQDSMYNFWFPNLGVVPQLYIDGCAVQPASSNMNVFLTQGFHNIRMDFPMGATAFNFSVPTSASCPNQFLAMTYPISNTNLPPPNGVSSVCGVIQSSQCIGTLNAVNWNGYGLGILYVGARFVNSMTVAEDTPIWMNVFVDDGENIYIDDQLSIVQEWTYTGGAKPTQACFTMLSAGTHRLRIEYYEVVNNAIISTTFVPLCPLGTWKTYYHNTQQSSTSGIMNGDPLGYSPPCLASTNSIFQDFGSAATQQIPEMNSALFGVRNVAAFNLPSGYYTFNYSSSFGSRLTINNTIQIWNNWITTSATPQSTRTVYLNAGQSIFVFDWNSGTASQNSNYASLSFSSLCYPSNPCSNGASCSSTSTTSFTCTCAPGFFGPSCSQICPVPCTGFTYSPYCNATGMLTMIDQYLAYARCNAYPGNQINVTYYSLAQQDTYGVLAAFPPPEPNCTTGINYAISWSGNFYFPYNAIYSFNSYSDDGSILIVDNVTLWNSFSSNRIPLLAQAYLTAGIHHVTYDYSQSWSVAFVDTFFWYPADCGTSIVATFFAIYGPSQFGPTALTACAGSYNITQYPPNLATASAVGFTLTGSQYLPHAPYTFSLIGYQQGTLTLGSTLYSFNLCPLNNCTTSGTQTFVLTTTTYNTTVTLSVFNNATFLPVSLTWATTCSSSPCLNGAACVASTYQAFSCNCVRGFSGPTCALPPSPCLSNPCVYGACTASLLNTNYTCSCNPGYYGTTCQSDINECASNPCRNGAACQDMVNMFFCTCGPLYTGVTCQTAINYCEAYQPCVGPSTCTPVFGGATSSQPFMCNCNSGYTGTLCESNLNECGSNPCANGGTCINGVNSYLCFCADSYAGLTCQTDLDVCKSAPCQNGGTCYGSGTFGCACATGFSGAVCDINLDDCLSQPCQNDGTCLDTSAGFVCQCQSAYQGTVCEAAIVYACADVSCLNGASCSDSPQGYACICQPGFSGPFCGSLVNPNLCGEQTIANQQNTIILTHVPCSGVSLTVPAQPLQSSGVIQILAASNTPAAGLPFPVDKTLISQLYTLQAIPAMTLSSGLIINMTLIGIAAQQDVSMYYYTAGQSGFLQFPTQFSPSTGVLSGSLGSVVLSTLTVGAFLTVPASPDFPNAIPCTSETFVGQTIVMNALSSACMASIVVPAQSTSSNGSVIDISAVSATSLTLPANAQLVGSLVVVQAAPIVYLPAGFLVSLSVSTTPTASQKLVMYTSVGEAPLVSLPSSYYDPTSRLLTAEVGPVLLDSSCFGAFLTDSTLVNPASTTSGDSSKTMIIIVLSSLISLVVIVALIVLGIVLVKRRHAKYMLAATSDRSQLLLSRGSGSEFPLS